MSYCHLVVSGQESRPGVGSAYQKLLVSLVVALRLPEQGVSTGWQQFLRFAKLLLQRNGI
jgi:hypothetical protein